MAELAKKIETLITPTLAHLGYVLVRVQLTGSGRNQTLQVMAERADTKPMTIEDCEAISRQLSAVLDVEDPISSQYRLEVSSPGIDRPLTRINDYARFAGHLATVELKLPDANNRKRYQGTIQGINDADAVTLTLDDGSTLILAFADIAKAKLVLTEKLIKAGISN